MHLRKVSFCASKYPADPHYPFNLGVVQRNPGLEFVAPVTFLVGENGTGKSTVLRALCRKCGIFIWGGFEETTRAEDELLDAMTIEWADGPVPGSFFSSELFHNFSLIVDEWEASDPGMLEYFGGKSLTTQSHGQSLMSYFKARYRIPGLYFMDEPETSLSPRSQLELVRVLADMSRAGRAQFIIASHSPILLSCPGACLYSFDEPVIRRVGYEDTETYRLYRDFLQDRRRFLR